MTWTIEPETPADAAAIDALIELCFGAGRYAKAAYRLREGVDPVPALSFVAHEEGQLQGSLRFWPILIGGSAALMLGPLAVKPALRGRGIGIDLMKRGIEAAKAMGFTFIILVGDEPYYARVGFSRAPAGQIDLPGPVDPRRLLFLELEPGALARFKGAVTRPGLDHAVAAVSTVLSATLDAPGEQERS